MLIHDIKMNSVSITECEYGKWGDNCAEDCLCSVDHAVSCNTNDGRCQCMDGWTSGTCSEDIDECLSQDTCNALSESCINTDGSYLCNCKDGFLRNSSLLCEGLCSIDNVHRKTSWYQRFMTYQKVFSVLCTWNIVIIKLSCQTC